MSPTNKTPLVMYPNSSDSPMTLDRTGEYLRRPDDTDTDTADWSNPDAEPDGTAVADDSPQEPSNDDDDVTNTNTVSESVAGDVAPPKRRVPAPE